MKTAMPFIVGLIALITILFFQKHQSEKLFNEKIDSLIYMIEVDRGVIDTLNETIVMLDEKDREADVKVVESVKTYTQIKTEIIRDTTDMVPMVDVKRITAAADMVIQNQADQLDIKDQIIMSYQRKDTAQTRIISNQDVIINEQKKEIRKAKIKSVGAIAIGLLIAIL